MAGLSEPAALITLQATVCGVNLSIPIFAWPPSAPPPSSNAAPASASASAAQRPQIAAPSAEVAELQRRLLAGGDADVASLMSPDPDQLDPLDARGIARWLKAKGRDLDVAEEQILIHAHWRKSYMPAGHIPEDTVQNELASEKVFVQGCDNHGRPMFIVFAKQQEQGRPEETKRFICYTLDNVIAMADSQTNELGQFLCLFDLAGLRMKNLDVGALQAVFEVLQQHYPERLGELWFLNAPFIFWGLWRVVSPFIQPATKDKIKFVTNKEKVQLLRQHIPDQVLPELYGGEAELIPIEQAVQARLVQEGMRRERIASNASAAAHDSEPTEGRWTRAGRQRCKSLSMHVHDTVHVVHIYAFHQKTKPSDSSIHRGSDSRAMRRWASASADFVRRHNPVHPVEQGRSLARIKDWRPFNRGYRPALYLDEATSVKSEDWADSGSPRGKSEGGVGNLVMYLMPQVLFVAIFRKAQQAIQWAWSHAQRIKHPPEPEVLHFSQSKAKPPPVSSPLRSPSRQQRQSPVRRMSMSCQRYTADVARRICHSLDGFQYIPSANLSPDGSPVSYRLLDDHQDDASGVISDSADVDPFAIPAAEASRLRRLWRRQLVEDAGCILPEIVT